MKKAREIAMTTVITALLIFVIAFCISGTVFSQNKGTDREQERCCRAAEREYVRQIRALLEEKGYHNSGVTLSSVIRQEGTKEYTVTIYHKNILKLDDGEKSRLAEECGTIDFPVEDCDFFHEFLEKDS